MIADKLAQKVHKNSPWLYTKTADRAKHASFDVRRGVSNPVCVLVYLWIDIQTTHVIAPATDTYSMTMMSAG